MSKIQKTIGKTIGIGALALALAGCGKKADKAPNTLNLSEEYTSRPAARQNVETFSQLEGKILKVQPSQISYVGDWDKHHYGSNTSANHEFEYVMVEGKDGKLHAFIYPFSKAILEKEATIKYRPLSSGSIDSETFIDTFLKEEYFTDDNILIEAEGIITRDGIAYK